jgi:hypothetical protein
MFQKGYSLWNGYTLFCLIKINKGFNKILKIKIFTIVGSGEW